MTAGPRHLDRDDPRFGTEVAATVELLEHLVLPVALAARGGHRPRPVPATADELTARCRALRMTASLAVSVRRRGTAERDCLQAAIDALATVTLAVHRGTMGEMVPRTFRAAALAALACRPAPHHEVALRLVLAGVPVPDARSAAEAALR